MQAAHPAHTQEAEEKFQLETSERHGERPSQRAWKAMRIRRFNLRLKHLRILNKQFV